MPPQTDRQVWNGVPTLVGRHASLAPLGREHVDSLIEAASDGELWKLWYTTVPPAEKVRDYVESALAMRDAGTSLPFVVLDAAGTVVGSTRFCRMEPANRRLEIGYTWYARRVQGGLVNPQAKRLLLGHAFETMDCIAVEFRTHWHNHRSRAAIERLGAKQDGVIRNHMILPDGTVRDTVMFSILDMEWPSVRRGLDHRLSQHAVDGAH